MIESPSLMDKETAANNLEQYINKRLTENATKQLWKVVAVDKLNSKLTLELENGRYPIPRKNITIKELKSLFIPEYEEVA